MLLLAAMPTAAAPASDDREYYARCLELGRAIRSHDKANDALLEAARQQGVVAADHAAIKNRQPRIGMNVCALAAALGPANRRNRSVTALGERYQLVYERPKRYVYVDNDRVTGWQD